MSRSRPESDADTIVNGAYESVEDQGYRSAKTDAGSVAEIAPAEKGVGFGLERVVGVSARLLDDRLLGASRTCEDKHRGDDKR